jgi:two-component system, LuxR family, sensor kinase FixL
MGRHAAGKGRGGAFALSPSNLWKVRKLAPGASGDTSAQMPSSQFIAVMDAAVDAVILIDHTGHIGAFNRSAERLFGWSAAEVLGQNVAMLMPEPDRSAHDAYLARYLESGIAHIIGVGRELQAQRRDGSCFPAHLSVGRVAGAEPPQFVGFIRDITAERQALAAIQAERDLAKAYLQLGHSILLTLDAQRRIRVISPRACQILGADETALLGQDWSEVAVEALHRDAARAELARTVTLPPQEVHAFELPLPAQSPSRLLEWRCLALRTAEDRVTGFLCSAEDITERRQKEEEARRATNQLVHVARLATMGEMAAGIAHELNQPLTAITNYARACERFLQLPEPDLAESRDAVREIGSEALRAGEIIRRLRRLVRSDNDEGRHPSQINEVIEDLRLLTVADARVHDTRIVFDLATGLPPVLLNRVHITQVLLNLIRNALEALAGQPRGSREITIRSRSAENGDVEVSVCDNGPGVDPGIVDRMFDPFCTTKPNGTGLGLPMSRTIVSAHGGTVNHVPARPGACFVMRLPGVEQ